MVDTATIYPPTAAPADAGPAPRHHQLAEPQDDLGPSRGIIFGILLSLPLWGGICGAALLVFHYL